MKITIYHNPACSTSRNTLGLMRNTGVDNRPIVVTPIGTKLCRPSEVVLNILPLPQLKEFIKEDGEKVIDMEGRRVSTAN